MRFAIALGVWMLASDVSAGETLVREVEPAFAREVAVERPDRRWVSLRIGGRLRCDGTALDGTVLRVDPARAVGLDWMDQPRRVKWAFDVPGRYVVWVAANLETEQDNATHQAIAIEFAGTSVSRAATPDPALCDVALD